MDRICILGVFAHPDDEFCASGLIIKAIEMGAEVHLVLATKGEAGRIRNSKIQLLKSMCVADIRVEEYEESCEALRITKHYYLGLEDGKSKEWDFPVSIARLKELIQMIKPTHVIGFDRYGCNGHPDHIATTSIVESALQDYEGLEYLEVKLFSRNLLNKIFWWLPKRIKMPLIDKFCVEDDDVTYIYRLSQKELSKKLKLLEIYNSQFPDEMNRYYKVKKPLIRILSKYECYHWILKQNTDLIRQAGWNFR